MFGRGGSWKEVPVNNDSMGIRIFCEKFQKLHVPKFDNQSAQMHIFELTILKTTKNKKHESPFSF